MTALRLIIPLVVILILSIPNFGLAETEEGKKKYKEFDECYSEMK